MLKDDLNIIMVSGKLVDDVALIEITEHRSTSRMQFAADHLSSRSLLNLMIINIKKTEMQLGIYKS